MPNDIDLSNEALLKHRAIAEKATPGPWAMGGKTCPWVEDGEGNGICRMLARDSPRDTATHIAANSPDVVKTHIDEILRLRAELERLNKKADWLALNVREAGCPPFPWNHLNDSLHCVVSVSERDCASCWREAARKAVEKKA